MSLTSQQGFRVDIRCHLLRCYNQFRVQSELNPIVLVDSKCLDFGDCKMCAKCS